MAALVFAIGAINITLGYALACYLRCAMDAAEAQAAPPCPAPPPTQRQPAPGDISTAETKAEESLPAEVEAVEVIPSAWVDQLEAEAIEAAGFVEAAAQVMRLEVGKYREALVHLEEEMRKNAAAPDELAAVVEKLIALNEEWMAVQAEASNHLSDRMENAGPLAETARRLDSLLLEQQAQIESTCNNLTALNVDDGPLDAFKSLTGEFARLVNLAHQLRDGVGEALLATLRADGRVGELDENMLRDGLTIFKSRAGFEVAVENWWQSDAGRTRLSSAALLDIAQLGRFNRQSGTRFGDRLIAAAGSLLEDLVRKDRGFEVVARVRGQQFLLFFGDTGPRNATSAAERMRQSFAAATFENGEDELAVNVTCAVTEVLNGEDVPTLLKRLAKTLAAAKASGRNCTMLDEGNGPQPVAPPDYQISGRAVAIEAE